MTGVDWESREHMIVEVGEWPEPAKMLGVYSSSQSGIRCGRCKARHSSVTAVRACYQGDLFACHWLVEAVEGWVDEETGQAESWVVTRDCGAEAVATERGWTCAAGHEHVNAQARHNEGWDYAEEYGEATAMVFAGVEPRTMSGHVVTGAHDFVPAGA